MRRSAAFRLLLSSATISAAARRSTTCGRFTAVCVICSRSTSGARASRLRERRTLARIAPHAVRPLPFALPLYRSLTRGKLAMRAGFLLDRLVASAATAASPRLCGCRPAACVVAARRRSALSRAPAAGADRRRRLVRLRHARIRSPHVRLGACGARTRRRPRESCRSARAGPRWQARRRACARSRLASADEHSRSRPASVVNATGGAVDRLLPPLGLSAGVPMLKAMNLVTRRDAGDEALGGRSRAGRNLFLVPWRERALFGTWESASTCGPDRAARLDERDVAAFVSDLNEAFPSLDLTLNDITLVHRGIVPAVRNAHGRVSLRGARTGARSRARRSSTGWLPSRDEVHDRARGRRARHRHARWPSYNARPRRAGPAATALPGGSIRDMSVDDRGRATRVRRRAAAPTRSLTSSPLTDRDIRDVLEIAEGRADLKAQVAQSITSDRRGTRAGRRATKWRRRWPMPCMRRTPLGALGDPDAAALATAAALVGGELGWSGERRRAEIDAIRAFDHRQDAPATAP